MKAEKLELASGNGEPRKDGIRQTLATAIAQDPGLAFCGLGLFVAEALLATMSARLNPGHAQEIMVYGMIFLAFAVLLVAAYTIRMRSRDVAAGKAIEPFDSSASRQANRPTSLDSSTDPHTSDQIPSDQALVEVEFEKIDGKLANPRVSRISDAGKRFFGYANTAPKQKTIGRNANELMKELEGMVSPPVPHWEDLGKDQQRVYDLLFEGREAYARVPVRFNDKHHYFPNKTFLPLIVERGEFQRNGTTIEFRKAIYLDVTTIPTHLFSQHAWHEVGRKLTPDDMRDLADQFSKIREAWQGGDRAVQFKTRGEHVQEVERVLRGGGGADVVYHCAEAGWFSLWEMAKALELGKAQQFLLAVAGSFDDLHV
jgi:hypothetical protein